MYWKGFNRLLICLGCCCLLLITSCKSHKGKSENKQLTPKKSQSSLSLKKQINRMVESELNIGANEKYSSKIIVKNLNADTIKDAVVLVNRQDFAYAHFKNDKSTEFFDKMGHTASYNYVFVKLGGQNKLIYANPMAIGSNVDYKLSVRFLRLTSPTNLDFCVTYRIRNSLHNNYYTIRNHQLFLVFSYPVFDNIGDPVPTAYKAIPKISELRTAKDIALYKAKIIGYNTGDIEDLYGYKAKGIEATDSLVAYFIFNPKKMKYVTPMKPIER